MSSVMWQQYRVALHVWTHAADEWRSTSQALAPDEGEHFLRISCERNRIKQHRAAALPPVISEKLDQTLSVGLPYLLLPPLLTAIFLYAFLFFFLSLKLWNRTGEGSHGMRAVLIHWAWQGGREFMYCRWENKTVCTSADTDLFARGKTFEGSAVSTSCRTVCQSGPDTKPGDC